MNSQDLKRLEKIENRVKELLDEWGLKYCPVEFDIIPPEKMLEIMAYGIPTNVSNWKYGRDWERIRTIYEKVSANIPYEVVIANNPARAYLMNNNLLPIQALVLSHVYGHVNFFTENKYFKFVKDDIVDYMSRASEKLNKFERAYGVDEVERIVDAGHSIAMHSSPFEPESEDVRRKKLFEQMKKSSKGSIRSEFGDTYHVVSDKRPDVDIELYNQQLWRVLKNKTPIEPTEDILRYIIDNSRILEDWQKEVLEVLRVEGQYVWPLIRTKYMNEGWATHCHQRIMGILFKEGLLDPEKEFEAYNRANSWVKAFNPFSMNPYQIGSKMWEDIEMRWDKGRHGTEYDNCTDWEKKKNWDTKEGKGWEKCKEIMRISTDWMFMRGYLTEELVRDLQLYLYVKQKEGNDTVYRVAEKDYKEVKDIIAKSFIHSSVPKIEVVDGNHNAAGILILKHAWGGIPLDEIDRDNTMRHIMRLWGNDIVLVTKTKDKETGEEKDVSYSCKYPRIESS